MKDDHMQNGQLKPAYNLQGPTNNQYLTNLHTSLNHGRHYRTKGLVNDHIENYAQTPEALTADAGYGSEENYTDLEAKQITAYVKITSIKNGRTKRKQKMVLNKKYNATKPKTAMAARLEACAINPSTTA
nr:transposase [Jejuia pallidilutea]